MKGTTTIPGVEQGVAVTPPAADTACGLGMNKIRLPEVSGLRRRVWRSLDVGILEVECATEVVTTGTLAGLGVVVAASVGMTTIC